MRLGGCHAWIVIEQLWAFITQVDPTVGKSLHTDHDPMVHMCHDYAAKIYFNQDRDLMVCVCHNCAPMIHFHADHDLTTRIAFCSTQSNDHEFLLFKIQTNDTVIM